MLSSKTLQSRQNGFLRWKK